jgi:hypothetical protein
MSSTEIGIAPADWAPSTATRAPREWASSTTFSTGRRAPVAQVTCDSATSRVPGVIARSMAASTASSSPPSPTSATTSSTPWRSRTAHRGPRAPGCSSEVVTALSPARQSIAHVATFMPSVVAWVRAIRPGCVPRTAAMAARVSAIRSVDSCQ